MTSRCNLKSKEKMSKVGHGDLNNDLSALISYMHEGTDISDLQT